MGWNRSRDDRDHRRGGGRDRQANRRSWWYGQLRAEVTPALDRAWLHHHDWFCPLHLRRRQTAAKACPSQQASYYGYNADFQDGRGYQEHSRLLLNCHGRPLGFPRRQASDHKSCLSEDNSTRRSRHVLSHLCRAVDCLMSHRMILLTLVRLRRGADAGFPAFSAFSSAMCANITGKRSSAAISRK